MREPHTAHSISLPISLWNKIYHFQEENNKSVSECVAIIIRHGLIKLKQEELKYATLAPTIEQDEALR